MNLKVEPFMLTIVYDGKSYRMKVEQTTLTEGMEIFTISANNKEVEVKSDRPLWRNSGLKNHKIKWIVVNGKVNYRSALETVIKGIEAHIRSIEKPPFDWKDHPKNSGI